MPVKAWNVGDVLSASDMNVWTVPVCVIKPADTNRNTTTTMTNDPDLVLPLAASASYDIASLILYSGAPTGTGDIKWTFTVPAGTTGRYSPIRQNFSSQYTGWALDQWTDTENAQTNGTGVGQFCGAFIKGILVTGGSAGNLTFQWAQNTSSATNTIVRQNSYLLAQRIA